MNHAEWNAVRRLVDKIKMRLSGLITRARVVSSAVTGRGQILTVGMLQGETRDAAEMFEPYGLAGAVPTGSEGIAFSVGGSRDQVIVVCASPKGGTPEGRAAGEVDIYSEHGQFIRLHTDGSISLQPGPTGFVYTGDAPNPATPIANRNGDPCTPTTEFATWMTAVVAALSNPAIVTLGNTTPPYTPPAFVPPTVANTVATATKTKVS